MKLFFIVKAMIVAATLFFANSTCAYAQNSSGASQNEFTPVNKAVPLRQLAVSGVKRVVRVWPTEISLGDNVYCCCYDFNDSDSPFAYSESNSDLQYVVEATLSIPGKEPIKYSDQPIRIYVDSVGDDSNKPKKCDIRPGEKSVLALRKWRVPSSLDENSLGEYDDLFESSDEIICELNISAFSVSQDGARFPQQVCQTPLRIKKRDEGEMRLLSEWIVLADELKKNAKHIPITPENIELVDLNTLHRLVNPDYNYSDPQLSEDKWAEIENQLSPSGIKDEATFAKMLVSYYTEEDEQKTLVKRDEFVTWIMDRPEPQFYDFIHRFALTPAFCTDSFRRKHLDLLETLYLRNSNEDLRSLINFIDPFSSHGMVDYDDPSSILEFHRIIDGALRFEVQLWPINIKLGDPFYCRCFVKNVSNDELLNYPISGAKPLFFIYAKKDNLYWSTSSENAVPPKTPLFLNGGSVQTPKRNLLANTICDQNVGTMRIPGADELDSDFWLNTDSLKTTQVLHLHINDAYYFLCDRKNDYGGQFAQTQNFRNFVCVNINPRSRLELDLLKDWQKKANEIDQSSISEIAKARPDDLVGAFLRLGNPFPYYPNAPETVEGWRALEEQFEPSALRDEITFLRMIMEYYDEKSDEDANKLLKNLFEWLKARPAPQLFGLIDSIRCGKFGDETNEIYKKRVKGLVVIFDYFTDDEFSRKCSEASKYLPPDPMILPATLN